MQIVDPYLIFQKLMKDAIANFSHLEIRTSSAVTSAIFFLRPIILASQERVYRGEGCQYHRSRMLQIYQDTAGDCATTSENILRISLVPINEARRRENGKQGDIGEFQIIDDYRAIGS